MPGDESSLLPFFSSPLTFSRREAERFLSTDQCVPTPLARRRASFGSRLSAKKGASLHSRALSRGGPRCAFG